MQSDYRLMMAIRSADLDLGQKPQLARHQSWTQCYAAMGHERRRYAWYVASASMIAAMVSGLAISS